MKQTEEPRILRTMADAWLVAQQVANVDSEATFYLGATLALVCLRQGASMDELNAEIVARGLIRFATAK